MALVTLAEYQTAVGSTDDAPAQQQAIDDASAAVINHAQRNFGAAAVTEDRTFQYNGKGFLEIDDCTQVNTVTLLATSEAVAVLLPATRWEAWTEGVLRTIFTYLTLDESPASGAMGFTSNLDIYSSQFAIGGWTRVRVNAAYGWPTVPGDVKRATIITAKEFFNTEGGGTSGELTSKSVAEVHEGYLQQQTVQNLRVADAVPSRAQALLENYRRHTL